MPCSPSGLETSLRRMIGLFCRRRLFSVCFDDLSLRSRCMIPRCVVDLHRILVGSESSNGTSFFSSECSLYFTLHDVEPEMRSR